jgi:exopolyphosphatase/guanosine-5'-triphosphate,3'-diphosphate pyrophosphatase
LGHDVFTKQRIGKKNEKKFLKLLKAFKLLIQLYEADHFMICATSAMREAKNGKVIAKKVKKELGLSIEVIDGEREADLISRSIFHLVDENTYLHIDVGGGSTELNVYEKGKKIKTKSFKIGAVRKLEKQDSPEAWNEMNEWVKESTKKYKGDILLIATGGNISKVKELIKNKNHSKKVSRKDLQHIYKKLTSHTYQERVNIFNLNPDRADVIVPATEIYLSVMTWAKGSEMIVPDAGLKDGMIRYLYEENK